MNTGSIRHKPVLVSEVLRHLQPAPGKTILDLTLGSGGHAKHILERGADVIGVDRDGEALERARGVLAEYGDRVTYVWGRMSQAEKLLGGLGISAVDGCLIDAGISMDQMLDTNRGFSASSTTSLDMRQDRSDAGALTAERIVNEYLETSLNRVLSVVGRGREARAVARRIVRARQERPIQSTAQLTEVITSAMGPAAKPMDAARYLKAILDEVNQTLPELRQGIEAAVHLLRPTGMASLVILTWNSSEHRVSRQALRELEKPCVCPPALAVCSCGRKPLVRVTTPKLVSPTEEEIRANPAARSAKLNAAVRLEGPDDQAPKNETPTRRGAA